MFEKLYKKKNEFLKYLNIGYWKLKHFTNFSLFLWNLL